MSEPFLYAFCRLHSSLFVAWFTSLPMRDTFNANVLAFIKVGLAMTLTSYFLNILCAQQRYRLSMDVDRLCSPRILHIHILCFQHNRRYRDE